MGLGKNTKAYANKKLYVKNYNKEQMKQVKFYVHKTLDKDMVEWLDNHRPTSTYLKDLIKADMNKKGA